MFLPEPILRILIPQRQEENQNPKCESCSIKPELCPECQASNAFPNAIFGWGMWQMGMGSVVRTVVGQLLACERGRGALD
jgi:hypothetical protein